jgi:hypothetical protein
MGKDFDRESGKQVVLSRHIPPKAVFLEGLETGEKIIPGLLHFEKSYFQGCVSFSRALIWGEMMIRSSTVEGEFSLHQAIICGQLFCDNTAFQRNVDLLGATFVRGRVYFEESSFVKGVVLSEIQADSIALKKCGIWLEKFREEPETLRLNRIFVKEDLSLEGSVLKGVGIIDLEGTVVPGTLDLRVESDIPLTIIVSSREMAEKAHWSAPNWSIIIKD